MSRPVDLTALVAGIAVAGIGVLLLLNAAGSISLDFAYVAPLVLAALGLTLVASGMQSRRRRGG